MNQNTEYERFAQEIYQGLINVDGIKTIGVQHNVKLAGKSGQSHQIDVYWEYEYAGVKHKVTIECKNYNSAVPVGKVRDFYGVLSDLNNVDGIMVTKVGYQEGAKEYASHYGISLKELRTPYDHDWEGRLKTIIFQATMVLPNIKQRLPVLDIEWIRTKINPPEGQDFSYGGMADKIVIYDASGQPITNFYELDKKLPCKEASSDLEHTYDFDDAYMDLDPVGRVKINGIKYIYDVVYYCLSPITIDAQETVTAILKDALSGEIEFIRKK